VNYYRRFPGDYQRDTSHLSLAEHGAYTVLLDHYYALEQPLPGEMEALYRLCRAMTKEEQAAVRRVADGYFPINGDGHRHNRRADQEIVLTEGRRQTARDNGFGGGRPAGSGSKNKSTGLSKENPSGNPVGSCVGSEVESSPDSRLQTPTKNRQRQGKTGTSASSTHEPAWLSDFKLTYPPRSGDANWAGAARAGNARVREGHTVTEFLEGARRYAQFCRATDRIGTQFVQQPATFLGPRKGFLELWVLKTKTDARADSNLNEAAEFMRRTEPTDADR
jgi:uncharacterized protein YdaU (DUF1376 family)